MFDVRRHFEIHVLDTVQEGLNNTSNKRRHQRVEEWLAHRQCQGTKKFLQEPILMFSRSSPSGKSALPFRAASCSH